MLNEAGFLPSQASLLGKLLDSKHDSKTKTKNSAGSVSVLIHCRPFPEKLDLCFFWTDSIKNPAKARLDYT